MRYTCKRGEYSGFIASSKVVETYLLGFLREYEISQFIPTMTEKVAVLASLRVYTDYLGKGWGKELVKRFVKTVQAKSRKIDIILVADTCESSHLLKFYTGLGFKKIANTPAGPLMKFDRG
jgi:N-acetylglutamate synthase-like GNAT family acetyltransferase